VLSAIRMQTNIVFRSVRAGELIENFGRAALLAVVPVLPVLAYPRPAALLTVVPVLSVRADPRPAALFTRALLPPVFADPFTAAVLAKVPHATVRTPSASPAFIAVASLDAVRTDSFTTAVQTEVPLLPVLTRPPGAAVRNFAPLFTISAVDSVLAYPRPAAIHALRPLAAVWTDRRAAAIAA
jgi:hypothetical protein